MPAPLTALLQFLSSHWVQWHQEGVHLPWLESSQQTSQSEAQSPLQTLFSEMMRVDHGLIGRVWVQAALKKALSLVHSTSQRDHLWLHCVTEISGLIWQGGVWFLGKRGFQLLKLLNNTLVDRLPVPRQLLKALVFLQILRAGWQNASLSHLDHGLHLAAHAGDVVLIHHLLARLGLLRGVDLQGLQQLLVLLRVPSGNGLGRGVEVWQATLAGLNWPLCGVAIPCEDHVLVLLEDLWSCAETTY